MNARQMIKNQRIADAASLLAAQEGRQDRVYDEVDVDLILRGVALRSLQVAMYHQAIGTPPHPGGPGWPPRRSVIGRDSHRFGDTDVAVASS